MSPYIICAVCRQLSLIENYPINNYLVCPVSKAPLAACSLGATEISVTMT